MFIVALTGGIASGKSTVAALFAKLGVTIIDTDAIAAELVEPNTPTLATIIKHFGDDILQDATTQQLDRRRLRDIIFNDVKQRQWLEALLHPLIMREARARAQQAQSDYCIMVIPLLAETGLKDGIDRVLVVDAEESQQRKRLKARDNSDTQHINAALAAQAARAQRLAIADDVIDNRDDLDTLEQTVAKLHSQYLSLAQAK